MREGPGKRKGQRDFPLERSMAYYRSPIGIIEIVGTERGILSLDFADGMKARVGPAAPVLAECLKQIDEYFRGRRKVFALSLDLRGTDFQKAVCGGSSSKIPFGKTTTYRWIARALGNGKAMRAVGGAQTSEIRSPSSFPATA